MMFPQSLQPSWVDDYRPSSPADVVTPFDMGSTSRLQLTAVPSGATLRVEWNAIDGLKAKRLLEFFQEVGRAIAFELPPNFFHCNYDLANSNTMRHGSPTNHWRFDSMETSRANSTLINVVAVIISEIDP